MKHDPNARHPPGEPDPMRESAFDRAFRDTVESSRTTFDRLRESASNALLDSSSVVAAVVVTAGYSARERLAMLWDGIGDGLKEVVKGAPGDIAKKVIEEGWFGREVSSRDVDVLGNNTSNNSPAAADVAASLYDLAKAQAETGNPNVFFYDLTKAQAAILPPADPSQPDPNASSTPEV